MQSKYRAETAIQTLCFELRWDVTVYLKKKKKKTVRYKSIYVHM